jgi:hypothetical protein
VRLREIVRVHSECAQLAGNLGLDRVRSLILAAEPVNGKVKSTLPPPFDAHEALANLTSAVEPWSALVSVVSPAPTHEYVEWTTKSQVSFGQRPRFRPRERVRVRLWSDGDANSEYRRWYDPEGKAYGPAKSHWDPYAFIERHGNVIVPVGAQLDAEAEPNQQWYVVRGGQSSVGPTGGKVGWGMLKRLLDTATEL